MEQPRAGRPFLLKGDWKSGMTGGLGRLEGRLKGWKGLTRLTTYSFSAEQNGTSTPEWPERNGHSLSMYITCNK